MERKDRTIVNQPGTDTFTTFSSEIVGNLPRGNVVVFESADLTIHWPNRETATSGNNLSESEKAILDKYGTLTAEQAKLLKLLAAGMGNIAIAAHEYVQQAPSTIKNKLIGLFDTLNVSNRVQAARFQFLVDLPKRDNSELVVYTFLSKKEREILELLTLGFETEQIAKQLSVGNSTVFNLSTGIFTKLGVSNRVGAARVGFLWECASDSEREKYPEYKKVKKKRSLQNIRNAASTIPKDVLESNRLDRLTSRQLEVFKLLVQHGEKLTYADLSPMLGMSNEQSFKNIASLIYKKLGVKGKAQAIALGKVLESNEKSQESSF